MYGALYYIAIVLLRCSHFPLFLFFSLLSIWSILRGWNDPLVISFATSCSRSNETVSVVFIFDSIRRTKAAFPFFSPSLNDRDLCFKTSRTITFHDLRKSVNQRTFRGAEGIIWKMSVYGSFSKSFVASVATLRLKRFCPLTRENFSIWRPRARLFILVSVSQFRSPRW